MSIFDFVLQQYSSYLAQYKKQTFGGFYCDEVMAEIKRGTLLVGIHYLSLHVVVSLVLVVVQFALTKQNISEFYKDNCLCGIIATFS